MLWSRNRLSTSTADNAARGSGKTGPLTAIRQFCLECQGASGKAVRACADRHCPLWDWRLALLADGSCPVPEAEAGCQALRAIRRQCMLCAGDRQEVRACAAREVCVLWRYRFGVRPQTYKAVRRRFFAPKPLSLL